jgi:beta-N-acetylhexosaminidase
MKRLAHHVLVLVCLTVLWVPLAGMANAESPRPAASDQDAQVEALLARMTTAEKVGQLFLVTFQGDDVSPESDIAVLVRDYRVGGVVLSPSNGNFRNVPVPAPEEGAESAEGATESHLLSTPQQVARLANLLQALAVTSTEAVTSSQVITPTVEETALPPSPTPEPTEPALSSRRPSRPPRGGLEGYPEEASSGPTPVATPEITPTIEPQPALAGIPLFIALDWAGDDTSFFSGSGGFTPLPSAMAIGATWSPELAEAVGRVVGQELRAVGVNLLLGPTLDVLDLPRPGSKGDLDIRTFGGDPFWVGQMGQAFIRGVQAGGQGAVLTAAKHFPGQGGSDRRPDDEVATVQKSMQQLRQIELAPFAAVTAGGDLNAPGTTAALMTSHIRYRGFQGNIRQLTPPISLAPELQDLMELEEFAEWRAAGGVLISDALGVPAVRRYYDPQLQKFPHRQVAQDAFLAGNDLLLLSRFALTDNWPDQFEAIKETILFFQQKYEEDSEFRARVDAALRRVLGLKLRIYGENWQALPLWRDIEALDEQVGRSVSVTQAVARAALTLIYPGREELADRMPSAPLADENILIVTDARTVQECPTCDPVPLISPTAIEEIILRLYGPKGTGQISPKNVRSLTFADLYQLPEAQAGQPSEVDAAIAEAKWIIFAQLDYRPEEYPESAALRNFLAKRSDSLRDKRLVVLAFSAPYYLDTTEISKLTAYFGVYGKTAPFLEAAVRALFREFTPSGAPPVTISGINYELIRQLEPAPGQIISLGPAGPAADLRGQQANIRVGSSVILETGVIVDRNGHPVPDGTPVEFRLRYPAEALELAPKIETTVGGRARTVVTLDRTGELWITAQAGEAKDSTRIELRIGGGNIPGSIATVMPSPTPIPTATAIPVATETPSTMSASGAGGLAGRGAGTAQPRVTLAAFLYALIGTVAAGGVAFTLHTRHTPGPRPSLQALVAVLWAATAAWIGYLMYAIGWLPGASQLQAHGYSWAAGVIALLSGLVSLLWSGQNQQ